MTAVTCGISATQASMTQWKNGIDNLVMMIRNEC
jgi:hypothetical protein